MSFIRIAVLSDLHVYVDGGKPIGDSPSYLKSNAPADPLTNPVVALNSMANDIGEVDFIVCPGDITDRAHPDALRAGWQYLQEIKNALKAKEIIVTNGNHDLDFHNIYNKNDPKGFIQRLVPHFPAPLAQAFDKYWSRNYAIFEYDDIRFLTVNSAAHHFSEEERKHGRISQNTVDWIADDLRDEKKKPVNILVCHHHPIKLGDIQLDDYEAMEGGAHLLKKLEDLDLGRWIVIHGHRHFPAISYAGGGSSAPLLFSAGSFSAVLFKDIAGRARNQFYVLELDSRNSGKMTLPMRGLFRSWFWSNNVGWKPSAENSGLPSKGGFGFRGDIDVLVENAFNFISGSAAYVTVDELCEHIEEVRYLLPDDTKMFIRKLLNKQVKINYDSTGNPEQLMWVRS